MKPIKRAPFQSIGPKATTPSAESAARGSRNGGAVSSARKRAVLTPAQRWAAAVDEVIERFKATMREMYADDPDGGE